MSENIMVRLISFSLIMISRLPAGMSNQTDLACTIYLPFTGQRKAMITACIWLRILHGMEWTEYLNRNPAAHRRAGIFKF